MPISTNNGSSITDNRTFYGYYFTIDATSIEEQTGLNASNIIGVTYINPNHRYGGGGFRYMLSGWYVYGGKLKISVLCENSGNGSEHPATFTITLKMLNKLI